MLTYHVLDKTITIFEHTQPNAGIKFLSRSKFLERTKVRVGHKLFLKVCFVRIDIDMGTSRHTPLV